MEINKVSITLTGEDLKRLSAREIESSVRKQVFGSEPEFLGYLKGVLEKDEMRMVGSKEALTGYYDTDIEINRWMQQQLKRQ